MSEQTDEDLMIAYRGGDEAAFDELFRRYAPALHRFLCRGLGRSDDAADLLQLVFLQLHRHRHDYQADRRLRPWLYTIALNVKRQHLRRRPGRNEAELDDASLQRLAQPPLEQEQFEARDQLQTALEEVSEDAQEVLLLHWLGGVPLPEVAVMVGASLSAVKVRAHRAYAKMRTFLDGAEPPPKNVNQNAKKR